MSFRESLTVLRKRWLVIALLSVLGLVVTGAMSFAATESYRSTAGVYFSLPSGSSGSDLSQGSTYTQSQMMSYAELATKPIVLDRVIDDLHLNTSAKDLAKRVTATASTDTVIVQLAVSDTSAKRASKIANSVATELSKTVRQLAPKNDKGNPTIDATTVQVATPASYPYSPNTRRNLAAGLMAGVFLGILLALGREVLDTRVRSASDIADLTQAPVLGEISGGRDPGLHTRLMREQPRSSAAESFRRVRTNLSFLRLDDRPLTVVVTSATSGEGKSTTALNLATTIAESNQRVLLIDGDLRRPSIADYTGLEGEVGLTTVLIGQAELDDVVQKFGEQDLDVLTSGEIPPNPSELLGSKAMERLLDQARERYDVILIDCAPLLPVTDAAVLASSVSGAVIVASCAKLHRHQLQESLANLENVHSRVLGIVLNQVKGRRVSAYYGYGTAPEAEPVSHRADQRRAGRRRGMHAVGDSSPRGEAKLADTSRQASHALAAHKSAASG